MQRQLKILLVYPNIWSDVFPLALLILSAVLKQQGFNVHVHSALYRRHVNAMPHTGQPEGPENDAVCDFLQAVENYQPNLIAFSVVEDAFPLASLLLNSLTEYPGTVIVGGVFATFAPEKVICHPQVTAVCIGEGERALTQLCHIMQKGKPLTGIDGLWIKHSDGSLEKNRMAAPVDVNQLPPPDYALLESHKFAGPVPIIAHRGCPYPCTFCNSPSQATLLAQHHPDSFFRKHFLTTLQRDLTHLTTHHADKLSQAGLYFCSDTLLAWTAKEFDAFLEMYSDFRIPFICHTTPETISAEKVRKLADVGMKLMNIGVQHGNEVFRREILKRKMPNDELIRRFQMASGHGAWITADFILGFPLETPALVRDTIDFSRKIRADVKNCSLFVPYHGTPLRQLAIEKGFLREDTLARWSPEQSQLTMPLLPNETLALLMREFKRPPGSSGSSMIATMAHAAPAGA